MKKEVSNSTIIKIAMIMTSLFLAIPSIWYLVQNKTVYRYIGMYCYAGDTAENKILNVAIFIVLFAVFSLLYYLIIKNAQKLFKNNKRMWLFIIVIALLFMIIIPCTSSDVYSYIANRMGR